MENPTLSVVVPVFNEEEVIGETHRRLTAFLGASGERYEILYINDGSRDKTLGMIRNIAAEDKHVRVLSFSRNFGHQTAITCGMDHAAGEAIVVIDADLQDPPEVIGDMIAKWREGYKVVYGKRLVRKGESIFKKLTAKLFYRFLRHMTDVDIPVDTGDFRLLDRQVRDALQTLPEHNRYVRGLVSWVGFKQTSVDYVREERFAGVSKYPLKAMLKFAGDAISSFSYKPIKMSIKLGLFFLFVSLTGLVATLILDLFTAVSVWPWLYPVTIGGFFYGLLLLMLGFVGSYVARIYDEARGRPLYILESTSGFDEDPVGRP